MHELHLGATTLTLCRGDITKQTVDVIVNAANSSLLGGGGVDGAIHRTGGPDILAQCREIVARQGGCKTGEAVITDAGKMPCSRVIHTVGPVWNGGTHGENVLLERAYSNSLTLAAKEGLRKVAFPSISTGAYRFPIDRAALIALGTLARVIKEKPEAFTEVRMVLFSEGDLGKYSDALQQISQTMLG